MCIMKNNKEINEDSIYCESNISYLENIPKDIEEGKAHFSEHGLIEDLFTYSLFLLGI